MGGEQEPGNRQKGIRVPLPVRLAPARRIEGETAEADGSGQGSRIDNIRHGPRQQAAPGGGNLREAVIAAAGEPRRRTEGDQGEPFARLLPEHALLRLRPGEQLNRISKRNTCGGADQHRLAALSRPSLTRFQDAGKLLAESCLSERGSHSSSAGR